MTGIAEKSVSIIRKTCRARPLLSCEDILSNRTPRLSLVNVTTSVIVSSSPTSRRVFHYSPSSTPTAIDSPDTRRGTHARRAVRLTRVVEAFLAVDRYAGTRSKKTERSTGVAEWLDRKSLADTSGRPAAALLFFRRKIRTYATRFTRVRVNVVRVRRRFASRDLVVLARRHVAA